MNVCVMLEGAVFGFGGFELVSVAGKSQPVNGACWKLGLGAGEVRDGLRDICGQETFVYEQYF